ncbi:MAG: acyltransferase [Verrucomicrobiota bacterium JB023]|nr:acyltransferase [Verrucomicrobiota bacterium JB023]
MNNTERNIGIDIFRIFACLSVISLHVGPYPHLPDWLGVFLKNSGRWAVPYFFIVSGYYLGKKTERDRSLQPASRFLSLLLIASVVLLPLSLVNQGAEETVQAFLSGKMAFRGSYFHLWFLGAMWSSLFLIYLTDQHGLSRFYPGFSALAILSWVVFGTYLSDRVSETFFIRNLAGTGFILLGVVLSNFAIPLKVALCLVIAGAFSQLAENFLMKQLHPQIDLLECPIYFGTIMIAIGLFGLAQQIHVPKMKTVGSLAKNHTLWIYILHPYLIAPASYLLVRARMGGALHDLAIAPLILVLTFLLSVILRKIIHLIKHIFPESKSTRLQPPLLATSRMSRRL